MPNPETISEITDDKVDEIEKQYTSLGWSVERKKENGTWTIVATPPATQD